MSFLPPLSPDIGKLHVPETDQQAVVYTTAYEKGSGAEASSVLFGSMEGDLRNYLGGVEGVIGLGGRRTGVGSGERVISRCKLEELPEATMRPQVRRERLNMTISLHLTMNSSAYHVWHLQSMIYNHMYAQAKR